MNATITGRFSGTEPQEANLPKCASCEHRPEDLTVEERITFLISDHLGIGSTLTAEQRDKDLTELGADSLDTMEITMTIEHEFRITIEDEVASKFSTVNNIIAQVSPLVTV